MKHILNNISQEEKQRILEQHSGGKTIDTSKFRQLLESKLGEVKPLVMEQVTTTQTTTPPGDPSQATVDLTTDMTVLNAACTTFNNELKTNTKINLELMTSVTPEGQKTGGPYITITSAIFQKIYGTNRPYGMIGVELSKGYYGVSNWGSSTPMEASIKNLIISIKNLTGHIARGGETGSDKGMKFNAKYHDQISTATTTLFNTVDPIFRKLLGYKGYNSATTSPTGEVTISKTT